MKRQITIGAFGLVLSVFIAADAATYTLVKQADTPPRTYVWSASSTWNVLGVPGLTNAADTVVIPAPSGTAAQAPDIIDLGGQTYTLDTLTVSGRSNGYTFTNGTLIVNRIIEGDGSVGKSLFSANVRLAPQGDQLFVSGVGSDPDDMWFYGVIGDGVGGGDFSVNLFMNPAETRQYRPWYFYGPSTYLGGTAVTNWARFVAGRDSVTNGVGQIVSGPAGRGPVFLTDNGFLQTSGARTFYNPLILAGECGFGGSGKMNVARVYWANQNTGLVNDIPNEAKLNPTSLGELILE